MDSSSGWFFVLEGSDGSGKATQLRLLKARLEAAGYEVAEFDFPRYDKPSSYFIKQYLDGGFGPAGEVSPYTASLFYALDRYEAAPQIRQAISDGKIVLSNRYVGSNMAHQGAKFGTEGEQRGFFLWADSLEFQLMGIPRPVLNLFLRLPLGVTQDLLRKRAKQDGRNLDEHERNKEYLKKSLKTYDLLCQLFPKDFKPIDSAPGGKLLSVAQVSDLVWNLVRPMLPPPAKPGRPRVINLDQKPEPTAVVTNDQDSSALANSPGSKTTQKTISILLLQSLRIKPHLINAQELVWSKAKSQAAFYTPKGLTPKLGRNYEEFMRYLINSSKLLETELRKSLVTGSQSGTAKDFQDILSAIVPMAATVRAGLNIDARASRTTSQILDENQLNEAEILLSSLQKDGQEQRPHSLAATNKKSAIKTIENIIASSMLTGLPRVEDRITISNFFPSNELELIVEAIYPHTDHSLTEIGQELESWKYDQKLKLFQEASRITSPSLFEKARYQFDIVEEIAYLDKLLELQIAEQLEIQKMSPRFGYDVPRVIEELGVEDRYIACFDKSLELYSQFQSAGLSNIAPYVCLRGHRIRFQFSVNASTIFGRLESGDLYKGQLQVFKDLILKISEKHPTTGEMLASSLKHAQSTDSKVPNIKPSPTRRHQADERQKKRLR